MVQKGLCNENVAKLKTASANRNSQIREASDFSELPLLIDFRGEHLRLTNDHHKFVYGGSTSAMEAILGIPGDVDTDADIFK